MRIMKTLACGAVLAGSLLGASSASAANWDPQNTIVTGTSSNSFLRDANGNTVSCTAADARVEATGAVARITGATGATTNPVAYSGCTNSITNGATTVTTFGTWTFTATSTTLVDAVATPISPGGNVAVITIPVPLFGHCTITVPGPVNIPNNDWNNATHQLTINNTVSFPIHPEGACIGVATSGTLNGTFTLPSNVIIT